MSEFIYICGPCAMESEELVFNTATLLNNLLFGKKWIFKNSLDKANRTSVHGQRGLGVKRGVEVFRELKKRMPNVKITTDVHECWQVEQVADVVDVIQIPAFLCRQTDLITEAARASKIVSIKKGQWLTEFNAMKSLDKIKQVNPDCEAWYIERGSQFGYKLIVDMTLIETIKGHYDKFIFDCTHSSQRSRQVFGKQADRQLSEKYFLASQLMGYSGAFVEVHPNPEYAISDADSQIELSKFSGLIRTHDRISKSIGDVDWVVK